MELTLTIPVLCTIPLAPLVGSMLVGFFGTGFLGKQLSRGACQTIAILGVMIAFILSCNVLMQVMDGFTSMAPFTAGCSSVNSALISAF